MQCGDVRELMDSFLGEQLLVETTHEILRHVERCPACGAELEARRVLPGELRGLRPEMAGAQKHRRGAHDAQPAGEVHSSQFTVNSCRKRRTVSCEL